MLCTGGGERRGEPRDWWRATMWESTAIALNGGLAASRRAHKVSGALRAEQVVCCEQPGVRQSPARARITPSSEPATRSRQGCHSMFGSSVAQKIRHAVDHPTFANQDAKASAGAPTECPHGRAVQETAGRRIPAGGGQISDRAEVVVHFPSWPGYRAPPKSRSRQPRLEARPAE